ncbi:glycosyltransferase family 2 protein [Celeribacter arenosi]|uniref:Glycosyl transferase family 2 n=1 Tax=Celeribacter arenosi TaxID=792649 RepID=A0ABP7K5W8_9RHOB
MERLGITCLRDEGPWLLDWIAHHQAAGITHFLIASHDLSDGSGALLDALADAGHITHLPFTPKGPRPPQWQALKLFAKHDLYRAAEQALFFDVDEYLVVSDGGNISNLLPDDADAMPLRWHLFGHSGRSQWEDTPVTDRFTRAAPDFVAVPTANHFKTLHRPSAFDGLGVHRPKGKQARWVDTFAKPMPSRFMEGQSFIQLLGHLTLPERAWLNHYSVRSIEEFVLKAARGLPNHTEKPVDAGYWALRNFNTQEDLRIEPMQEATRAARSALAEFNPLHDACVSYHRGVLEKLKRRKEVVDLMWQLELMQTSTPPRFGKLRDHARLIQGIGQEVSDG